MQKITILALHLGYGGVERCVTNLANSLVGKYYVEILCIYKLYKESAFPLDKRVQVVYLTDVVPNRSDIRYDLKHFRIFHLLRDLFRAFYILRVKKRSMIDAIDSCDSPIIISTSIYLNRLLGEYKNKGVYAIGWEHNYNINSKKEISKFSQSCRNLDSVVMVNKKLQEFYTSYFLKEHISCRVLYIPNFIDDISKTTTDYKNKNLIAVGRLENCKGFLDLISVYQLVHLKMDGTLLRLVGDGSKKEEIFKKIVSNQLSKNVKMLGYLPQEEIEKLYDKSSVYVMTSYTESFGLVLLEAMAHGLPIVAFDSADGACELVTDGYNGYLIENRNEYEMASKVLLLLNDEEKRRKMGQNSIKRAKLYTKKEVMKKWENIFKEVRGNKDEEVM